MNYNEALIITNTLLEKTSSSLASAPKGHLRTSTKKKIYTYYHVYNKKYGSAGKYISKEKEKLIHNLAQKDYDSHLLPEIKKIMKTISLINSYNIDLFDYTPIITSLQEIYNNMSPAKKFFVTPYIENDEHYISKWLKQEYIHKGFNPKYPEIYTNSGIRVRSKSEKIIADKLDELKIPYLYEKPLQIDDNLTIFPDFTLLNTKTRKEIYFEHFGMMDNPDYSEKAILKINSFIKSNIIPGQNLLLTFETSSFPLNMDNFEKMLQSYFYSP
ncbi:MAG: hypothetical protein K6A23_10120 [Butyrivibrio sp.]|nr:hypothetical protein [Butyrivibrio sp.]